MVKRRMIVGMAAVAGLTVAACGGDDSGGGGQLTSGDGYSVSGALGELPASFDPSEGEIYTADLAAATEAAGLERPTDVEDSDAVIDWVMPLTGGRLDEEAGQMAFVPMAEVFGVQMGPGQLGEFEDELGWSVLDADSYVEYLAQPQRFSVISGSFDDETLSGDLIEVEDGIVSNSEGEDGEQDIQNRSAVDQLGRPLRLAQDGERIVASLQTPPVQEWVEGVDETFADDEDLAAVASALDDAEVFSAFLTSGEFGFDPASVLAGAGEAEIDALQEKLEEEMGGLPPSSFSTVGMGWAADDDGSVVTIAYQHASEDDASANAEALETVFADGSSVMTDRPLSELYDVEQIETDGTVVVVTLRPGPEGYPSVAMRALVQRDLPFVHA